MSPRLGLVLTALTLVIALLVATFTVRQSRRQIVQQFEEATARQASLRRDLHRAREQPTTAAASLTVVAPAPSAMKPAALPPRRRPPGLAEFASENPDILNEFAQSKRAELGRYYLPVLLHLGLNTEQRERFKDILAAEVLRSGDLFIAAQAQGLEMTDPAIVALRKKSEQQVHDELAELLGASGLKEYEDFERTLSLRGYADGLATQVAAASPLTAEQADQLTRALAEANPPYRNGRRADPGQVDWEAVDARAREILNPTQLAYWQRHSAHNPLGGSRIDQELEAAYRRAVERTKAAAATATAATGH